MTAEQFLDAVWSLTEANPSRADFIPRDKTLDTLETKGHWIWSYASASASAPAGETVAFLMRLDLPTSQRSARIVITCDNEYRVFVNSQLIHSDNDWPTVEVLDLSAQLNRENMEVVIVSRNAGLAPNPAGLFAEIHLVSEDGVQTEVGTDESWQWAIPPMEFAIEDIHRIQADRWSPAEKLDNPSFLGRDVNDRLRHLIRDLSSPPSTEPAFVRASMQKSDLLMRSLGRPNREQVVTTRPESLSTLQAIDLANGEILADVLERGAQTLFERDWESSEHLIRWIYHHALSRNPSDIELNLLSKAVQTPNSLEDVLWVIIMLPEFQWIR